MAGASFSSWISQPKNRIIAAVGGVLVLVIIAVVAVMMMSGGGSPSSGTSTATSAGTGGTGGAGGTGGTNAFPAGSLRPNLLRDPSLPSDQLTINRWFDTSAFVNPPALQFGNSPRSGLRGAPFITTDATVEKSFSIREGLHFDLRGEFYNLLNHAIFNIPGFTLGSGDFGAVTSARAPRTAQLAARFSF